MSGLSKSRVSRIIRTSTTCITFTLEHGFQLTILSLINTPGAKTWGQGDNWPYELSNGGFELKIGPLLRKLWPFLWYLISMDLCKLWGCVQISAMNLANLGLGAYGPQNYFNFFLAFTGSYGLPKPCMELIQGRFHTTFLVEVNVWKDTALCQSTEKSEIFLRSIGN